MIYLEKPDNFNINFEIVSCFVERSGLFVLLLRNDNKSQPNKWGVVAGKLELDESLEDAMIREIKEETGISANKEHLEFYRTIYVSHDNCSFVYHMFRLNLDNKPVILINNNEHHGFKWTSPKDSLAMRLVDDLDECIRMFYRV